MEALVFGGGVTALVVGVAAGRVIGALLFVTLLAGVCGVVVDWRLHRAHSHALRDPLTGLPNRVLLQDRVEQALKRSKRSGEPFALIVIDLDGFKDVNDLRGHGAGDAVLRTLAGRFETIMRSSDTVARVGGDEFVVLSLGTEDDDQAAVLAGRLRHALRRPFRHDGAMLEIDGSIGWSVYPADGETPTELLERADTQMYATKRDTVDEELFLRRGVDAGVVRDVESALERNELMVVYQPIIDLKTGAPTAVEALVRRLLPDHSLLPPAEFVPHVERTPVVRELTFLVVSDALRWGETWAEEGHELGLSVNIPYRLLDDALFAEGLEGLLKSSSLPRGRLTLEVVPAGPGAGAALDADVLANLAQLGVRLSLDDGGRAASFAALRVLPLDELKIDASFVHGVARSATDSALVHGMIDIGHALGLTVVAEGVETREAWSALAKWGCDYAQGFYVAGPTPAGRIAEWLAVSWPQVA